jgi:hypothetical protein
MLLGLGDEELSLRNSFFAEIFCVNSYVYILSRWARNVPFTYCIESSDICQEQIDFFSSSSDFASLIEKIVIVLIWILRF